MIDVTIRGKIAIRSKRKKISANTSASGRIPSPNIYPAAIPEKKPTKIKNVNDDFFF
jgi:hypothetical protein